MSLPSSTQRMTLPLLLVAVAMVAIAFAIWGSTRGVAALIGASIGVGNWFALRWLASRLVSNGGGKAAVSLLLVAKIVALMGIVFVLINRLQVDPIGLAFGLGVLFVGPVLAGLLTGGAGSTQSLDPSAVRSAREER
jgi:hypothetical protein